MHASLDRETLAMLDESMARFAQAQYAFERRHGWADTAPWYSTAAWREYAELGWLALALPEAQGALMAIHDRWAACSTTWAARWRSSLSWRVP